jgi:hypothetical protein
MNDHIQLVCLLPQQKSYGGAHVRQQFFLFSEAHEPVIQRCGITTCTLMKLPKTKKQGSYRYSITGSSITSAHHNDP